MLTVINRYYCRWYRMGTIGATDHLMMIALVRVAVNNACEEEADNDAADAHMGQYSRELLPRRVEP